MNDHRHLIVAGLILSIIARQTFADEPTNPAVLNTFGTQAGRIAGKAMACKFPSDQIRNYERAVLQFVNEQWTGGGGRHFTSSYNNAMRAAQSAPAPDFTTCQDKLKYDIFMSTNDPSYLTKMYNDSVEFRSSHLRPAVGMAVCREVLGTAKIYGIQTEITVSVRGFVDQISGNRIKITVASLQANTGNHLEYLQEFPPYYTKGLPTWEDGASWNQC